MFYNLGARFYHHLTKCINVCDFIFASMDKETVSKWGLLLKEYFLCGSMERIHTLKKVSVDLMVK